MNSTSKRWIFVIDTNEYAGNFERDLCAYITGQTGDCDVGKEYSKMFYEKYSDELFDGCIISEPDDHGCYRPCSIWMTKDIQKYNSVAIFFASEPTDEQMNIMKQRSIEFPKEDYKWDFDKGYLKDVEVLGFRLIEETTNVNVERKEIII